MTTYEDFLQIFCSDALLNLNNHYPDIQSIKIDFSNLQRYDIELSEKLLEHPDIEISKLEAALQDNPLTEPMPKARIIFTNIPYNTPVHKIGDSQINKIVSIKGVITQSGDVQVKLLTGAFECQRCGHVTHTTQPGDDSYTEPSICENDQCNRAGPYKLLFDQSQKTNEKKIKIQEHYDTLKPGQQPRQIKIIIRGNDLIDRTPPPGAEVLITGIVRATRKQKGNQKSSVFETYIDALHIEGTETDIRLTLSETEKEELEELASDKNIIDKLVKSTAVTVKGHEIIKKALLSSVVSGPNYKLHDGTEKRGYNHIVIVGDPGTAKTKLSEAIRQLVPRSQYAAGRGASGPGLTAAVVKDELSGGGYIIQAGAFILADKGLLVMDEMDKMRPEDVQDTNTALESSKIVVTKAGINQTFNARCPVIAIANPRDIRFDDYEDAFKQVNIPADTLSRFDLIFLIQDKPHPERDRMIADHIGDLWQEVSNSDSHDIKPEIDIDTMRKYIEYAKTFNPTIPDKIKEAVTNQYLKMRGNGNGTISANARNVEGLYRLVKSMAKLRLSTVCTIDDFKAAAKIQNEAFETFRDPSTGIIDIDSGYGASKSQRDRYKAIRDIIRQLQQGNGNTAGYSEIIEVAKVQGINDTEAIIKKLKRDGSIHEVKTGLYQVV